jgi:hypothetical protein
MFGDQELGTLFNFRTGQLVDLHYGLDVATVFTGDVIQVFIPLYGVLDELILGLAVLFGRFRLRGRFILPGGFFPLGRGCDGYEEYLVLFQGLGLEVEGRIGLVDVLYGDSICLAYRI